MQRKIHNQTLFVAALSVYFGLLIVGAPPHVLAQQTKAQAKQSAAPALNRRPLQNFTRQLKEQIAAGQIDLDAACSVSIQVTLAGNGKLSSSQINNKNGETALCKAAGDFVSAINESGAFAYLRNLSEPPPTNITFAFEAKSSSCKLTTVLPFASVVQANRAAMALYMPVFAAQHQQQTQANAEAQELLRTTEIATKEKELIIVTRLPRATLESLFAAIEKAN